jgi:signal transduction histidine kinase
MSATASLLRRYWPELLWSTWLIGNTVAIIVSTPAETIPYHNIWLSLAILYGYRMWRLRVALVLLGSVAAVSGAALLYAVSPNNLDEAAEVPMMSMLFLIMVWFATRRQAAADELQRSSERERDFVRDASHQLRTPITVARGHAELMRDAGDPRIATDAAIVLGEMERLSRISDRLLLLASAQEPSFIARRPVVLAELLEDAARRWEATARRVWRVRVDTHGTVMADPHHLDTAVDALIENAVKATSDGDRIEIRLRAEADTAVIEVSDNGVGIDPRHLERVFDRFWRDDARGARRNGGTGLGLSMVRAIVEGHGGSAEVCLRPTGGTTFCMRLPGFRQTPDLLEA